MAQPSKRKYPKGSFKFDKSVDTGPVDYTSMDPDLAKTINDERIRRQIRSHTVPKPRAGK